MSYTVCFVPEARTWHGEESVDLAFAAASCGILIEQPCGSRTSCGKCRVRVVEGVVPARPEDVRLLGADAVAGGWRLGCQLQLDRTTTIEIPPASRCTAPKSFGDDFLPGDAGDFPLHAAGDLGLAVDVGSTTLAVGLISLHHGTVLTTASALNPQVTFGSDVLSRIAFAQSNPGGVHDLHDTLASALNALIGRTIYAAGAHADDVKEVVVVGNPTMLHTLRSLDPAPLGQAPYRSHFESGWQGAASALGLQLADSTVAYLPPSVRCHVGADAVAAIIATGLHRVERPTVLIDIGTNSEIALGCDGRVLCTSASAGPAFEGANILHGMRGVPGAIEEVRVRPGGSILVRTIGGETPRGICGSGLIDAAAELLRAGVLEPSGRMLCASQLTSIPVRLRERIVDTLDLGAAVWLAGPPQHPIMLTATDIRQLQLAKASIAAGIRVLLEKASLTVHDLDGVLLAGAFGNYLRKDSAQAIGLVPPIDPERVHFVGNAAGVGARHMLMDRRARERAEDVAARAQYIELAGLAEYSSAFVDEMTFPIEAAVSEVS